MRAGALVVALSATLAAGACSGDPARRAAQPAGPAGSPSPSAAASASATPSAEPGPSSAPATSSPPAVTRISFVFPVHGMNSYAHTHHDYPATDIIAPCGATIVAATSGTVLQVVRLDTYDAKVNAGATRGGLSVSILGDDGVRYYGSHFASIEAVVNPGVRVGAGQVLGKVGRTGDASACHLHFGISPPCQRTGDWWIQRGVVWPWPYLDAWRAGRSESAADEVRAWQAANGCPTRPLTDP
jgi:murein DD-endopeptidase MepM/ murein hydrolase activator NlpD